MLFRSQDLLPVLCNPDYKEVDATHGKIGDVDVVWNITPSDDNAYQNNLDAALLNQQDAPADDKIDILCILVLLGKIRIGNSKIFYRCCVIRIYIL